MSYNSGYIAKKLLIYEIYKHSYERNELYKEPPISLYSSKAMF